MTQKASHIVEYLVIVSFKVENHPRLLIGLSIQCCEEVRECVSFVPKNIISKNMKIFSIPVWPDENGDKYWGWLWFTSNFLDITEYEQITHSENCLHFLVFYIWVSQLNIGPGRVKRVSPLDTRPPTTPQRTAKLQMLLRDCRRVMDWVPGRAECLLLLFPSYQYGLVVSVSSQLSLSNPKSKNIRSRSGW